MPRRRPTQPKVVAPNQPYGMGVQQKADLAVQALPAGGPEVAPGPGAGPPPEVPLTEIARTGLNPLDTPISARNPQRSPRPITSGLPVGPGPGPEALTMKRDRYGDFISELADTLDSPRLRRVVRQRSGMKP